MIQVSNATNWPPVLAGIFKYKMWWVCSYADVQAVTMETGEARQTAQMCDSDVHTRAISKNHYQLKSLFGTLNFHCIWFSALYYSLFYALCSLKLIFRSQMSKQVIQYFQVSRSTFSDFCQHVSDFGFTVSVLFILRLIRNSHQVRIRIISTF